MIPTLQTEAEGKRMQMFKVILDHIIAPISKTTRRTNKIKTKQEKKEL